jgi:M6 family metalloprotease-like protein
MYSIAPSHYCNFAKKGVVTMFAKKRFILFGIFAIVIALLALTTNSAYAAPVDNVPVTVTQPDGEELDLFASGDEYYNWLHDANGYTIIQDPNTGYYVYADLVNGELIPTEFIVGRADPALVGLSPYLNISPEKVSEIRQTSVDQVQSLAGEITYGPKTGAMKNLVVYIRFSGESEFTSATSTYTTMLNSSTAGVNSLYNYFREVSYNTLSVSSILYPTPGTTIISYQDSHTRGYYQPYNAVTNPGGYTGGNSGTMKMEREHTLLKGAINYVSGLGQFPSGASIDVDGDGNVDGVTFIVRGGPGGWSDLLWPHKWQFFPFYDGYTVTINGKNVIIYNFQMETMTDTGVLAHEMFHVIGSPDLYHYSSDGLQPVGGWDVMEVDGSTPEHMGCYMKFRYGSWISSIPVLAGSGTQVVNPLGTSSTNNCYRINSPKSTTEYFVVEYRSATGTFESSLPGSGLLVYRINTARDGQGNRNGPPDEVYIYRPGGTTSVNGSVNTANFSSNVGRTKINDTTNPSPFLSDGSVGGLSICNVGASSGTISFDYGNGKCLAATALQTPSGSIGTNYNPTYTWNQVSDSTWYYLWVNGPNGNVIKQWYTSAQANCNGSTCSVTPATTLGGGAHTWWIQTWNSAGNGPWSTGLPFSTPPAPGTATLLSPSGDIGTNYYPTYSWNQVSDSTWYYLWVNGPAGTPVIQKWYTSAQANCNGSTCSIMPATALAGGAHTWWVQTWNPAGYGPWSAGKSFSTVILPIPGQATLVTPSGAITNTTPTYTWNSVSYATWYYLWVSDASGTPVIQQWYQSSAVCSGSTCSVTPGVTLFGGSYTWWIQTWNTAGTGPWSAGKNFNLPVLEGFVSQFNGSATGWQTHSGSWNIASNQWYTTQGVPYYWASSSYNATYSNLDYQASMWRNGCDACANSLIIRGSPTPLASDDNHWNNAYIFQYTRNGLYSVWKWVGGVAYNLAPWASTTAVNQGSAWNTLRVIANGSNLYFYINGALVWSGSDTSFTLGRVGVQMYSDGTAGDQLWVDWATLTSSSSASPTDTISLEQQSLNEAAQEGGSPEFAPTK